MGYKVFVSYKYADSSVESLEGGYTKGTVRDYVDYLQEHKFSDDDLNKAEDDGEDLSQFKDETIRTHLKDKIWDSSITIALISPGMRELNKNESDQWIPWEISYSLRTQTRDNKGSLSNGVIAVVIPDEYGSYDYFIENKTYTENGEVKDYSTIKTANTFSIIGQNMFNQKDPVVHNINGLTLYSGECSYIPVVRWEDFTENMDQYLDRSMRLRDKIDDYNITKSVQSGIRQI